MHHSFGGPWTEEKLKRIDDYLRAYMTIFTGNPRASKLHTNYVSTHSQAPVFVPLQSLRTVPKVRCSRMLSKTRRQIS
jgi:hypothetical protein